MPDDPKLRRSRVNKGLAVLAEKAGYTPCQFAMRRLAEQAKILEGWKAALDVGRNPEDLHEMSVTDASKLYRREMKSMMEEERKWAKFFYPEMRATELTGADGEEFFKYLTDTERAARVAAILDAGRARRDDGIADVGEDVVTPAGPADGGTED